MDRHTKWTASQILCDRLVALLEVRIGKVAVNHAKTMCSLGTPNFAWSYHKKSTLRIYLYSKDSDEKELKRIEFGNGTVFVRKRPTMGSDWAQLSAYYFDLNSDAEVEAAIPLLVYAYENRTPDISGYFHPSEIDAENLVEGLRTTVTVNRYERDPKARAECIRIYGTSCLVCGFDFGRTYGEAGEGFIHVHHLNPLAKIGKRHKVNPREDLRPVCPNCHEMIHCRTPPFTMEEMRTKLSR